MSGKLIVVPWPHPITEQLLEKIVQKAPVKEGAGICIAGWTEESKPDPSIDLDTQIGIGPAEYRFSRALNTFANVATLYAKEKFCYELRDKIQEWLEKTEGVAGVEVANVKGQGLTTRNDGVAPEGN